MRKEYGKIIKALEKGALKRLTDAHTGAECFLRGDEIIFSRYGEKIKLPLEDLDIDLSIGKISIFMEG